MVLICHDEYQCIFLFSCYHFISFLYTMIISLQEEESDIVFASYIPHVTCMLSLFQFTLINKNTVYNQCFCSDYGGYACILFPSRKTYKRVDDVCNLIQAKSGKIIGANAHSDVRRANTVKNICSFLLKRHIKCLRETHTLNTQCS